MTHSAEWFGRSPAIARVNNAEAERWEDTDWEQIVLLYVLLHLAPSPVTRLHNRAICTPPPCGAVVFLATAWANFATKDITTRPCGSSPGF
jgi:predicted RNA polymerase sigma factor